MCFYGQEAEEEIAIATQDQLQLTPSASIHAPRILHAGHTRVPLDPVAERGVRDQYVRMALNVHADIVT